MEADDENAPNEETALLQSSQPQNDFSKTRNKGGLTRQLPKRGYCLVFNKEAKDDYTVSEEKESLVMTITKKNEPDKQVNLLANFKAANINYFIHENRDCYLAIISVSDAIALEWLDAVDRSVPIEPVAAIQAGRAGSKEFDLAHHTFCAALDQKGELEVQGIGTLQMLQPTRWNNIHIPYDTSLAQNIYKHPILNDRLYLNVVYDMLINDAKLGGAQFVFEKTKALKFCFALNDYSLGDQDGDGQRDTVSLSQIYNLRFFLPSAWFGVDKIEDDTKSGTIDSIREHYGEGIAFYFLFTVHYIRCLYPMIIVGLVWFIAQMVTGTIAVRGSMLGVLLAIVWTTVMLEYYVRLEARWRFKFGMDSYSDSEIPQPLFRGDYVVSPESGMVVETMGNWWIYFAKIVFSLSTMVLCMAVVIACVVSIWILKAANKNAPPEWSIFIGVLNAVEIQILNALYTKLAVLLNGWENHRLQFDYYNHLVVKRICFIVVNSFNSLFYIAFYEDDFESEDARLNAVRIQLLTLFITAILIQNSMEIGIPWLVYWVKQKLRARKAEKEVEQGLLSDADEESQGTAERTQDEQLVFSDIKSQMERSPTPSLLDNMAEVVILHGYIILFVVIFPLMPLLCLINNYFEIGIDYYNLRVSQRPIPFSSNGIGVWKQVLSLFNIVAVFSNMALLTFRTTLVSQLIGEGATKSLIFYFLACILLIGFQLVLRNGIDDASEETQFARKRQEQCEKYLVRATVKQQAKASNA